MMERYALERELEALGMGSSAAIKGAPNSFDHSNPREFQAGPLAPRIPASSPTLGFEFDMNFGFEREVVDAMGLSPPAGFQWPSEGLKITDHEWRDGTGKLKDGFVVTLDAVRMEIATVPFHINNDIEYNAVKNRVIQFGEELIKARKIQNSHLNVSGVRGHPTTFEHPRTVVNKPVTDPASPCPGKVKFPGDRKHATYMLFPVPLVIHRLHRAYPTNKALWAAPQATLTLPLAEFGRLVWEIRRTRGGAPGVAFTGQKSDRLGLRDDLAFLALKRSLADRKRRIGTLLSDGTKVSDLDFTRSITSLITILVMYMLTSIKDDHRDRVELFAKASLPLNVKTPLWQIHKFALNDREKLVLHELYTDSGKRQNLFALASGSASTSGTKKLFPIRTHAPDIERFFPVPTWDDLVDAAVLEKKIQVTNPGPFGGRNCIPKKGHEAGDEILIAPLSSKIDWHITAPLIAVEMRRLGFAPVSFRSWSGLMDRIRNLAKKVNP